MLGGTAVLVSGPCFDEADNITCVFDGIPTEGMFFNELQSLCAAPILSRTGALPFHLIVNGTNEFRGDAVFYSSKYHACVNFVWLCLCSYCGHPSLVHMFVVLCSSAILHSLERIVSLSASPTVSFMTAHEVQIESDSLLLETGSNINIRWTPESILPLFPPDEYTVDITLHTVNPDTEIWREVGSLASDIPNSGAIDITIPDVRDTLEDIGGNRVNGQNNPPAFHIAMRVSVSASIVGRGGTIANVIRRIIRSPFAKWSFVTYIVFELLGNAYCAWWNSRQPEGIGQEILDRVSPCPCTANAAGRQNSGFKRDNPITQRIFHPGSSSCFREVVQDR